MLRHLSQRGNYRDSTAFVHPSSNNGRWQNAFTHSSIASSTSTDMASTGFERLVRYEDHGYVHYGNLVEVDKMGFKVQRLEGSIEQGFRASGDDAMLVSNVYHL